MRELPIGLIYEKTSPDSPMRHFAVCLSAELFNVEELMVKCEEGGEEYWKDLFRHYYISSDTHVYYKNITNSKSLYVSKKRVPNPKGKGTDVGKSKSPKSTDTDTKPNNSTVDSSAAGHIPSFPWVNTGATDATQNHESTSEQRAGTVSRVHRNLHSGPDREPGPEFCRSDDSRGGGFGHVLTSSYYATNAGDVQGASSSSLQGAGGSETTADRARPRARAASDDGGGAWGSGLVTATYPSIESSRRARSNLFTQSLI